MTDEDYIRKAVELAEGWTYRRGGSYDIVDFPDGSSECPALPMDPWWLDALSTQLRRQAIVHGYLISSSNEVTQIKAVRDTYNTHVHEPVGRAQGKDFVMNDIKAIVDSKVLQS